MAGSAYLRWEFSDSYDEIGGRLVIESAIREAAERIPREHLRRLDAIIVRDRDPKGIALGVWRQDASGFTIELYVEPHVADALRAARSASVFALRLYLAHTLYHEVGHHVTLYLNRRTEPSRKKIRVRETLEKWAEQYVAKRLQSLCDTWMAPGGAASSPEERQNLLTALRFLNLMGPVRMEEAGPHPPAP